MNYKWNYQPLTEEQQDESIRLANELNIHPTLGQLLLQRGISTQQEAEDFFQPDLKSLHDPFLMKDMDLAVERLNQAIGAKERILVYGDYDVDGTTAVSLVYKFIRFFYSNITYYIPDRDDDGYGVSKQGIDFADFTTTLMFFPASTA